MKVLLDGMYDGLESQLQKMGYEAYSVKKLEKEEEKLGNDFNIITFAKEHEMVLVTSDKENGRACKANGFPCIFVNLENILERIILPDLKKL